MNWFSRILPGSSSHADLNESQAAALAEWRKLPDADLNSGHYQTRYVVIDVQADGPDPQRNQPIAIAAAIVESGATDINKLFYASLETEAQQVLCDFLTFCGKAPLVTYNTPFNQTLYQRVMNDYLGGLPDQPWLDLAVLLPSLFRQHSDIQMPMNFWLEKFGLQHPEAFHALFDAHCCAELLLAALTQAQQYELMTPHALMDSENSRRWLKG